MPTHSIAFDVTPLQNAHRHRGIGTYVRGLAYRLAAQSEVPIEFWGWEGEHAFEAPPPHRSVRLARFPMPQYRGAWLFAQYAMRRRSARSGVRAVHVTDPDALTSRLGNKRLLATVYDLIPLKEGVSFRQPITWIGYRAYLKALVNVEALFAISQQTADDIVARLHVPAARVTVAPPGIDPVEGGIGPPLQGRPYFMFIGGPNPNKNLQVILDAMARCTDLTEELRVAGHWLPQQVSGLENELGRRGLQDRCRFVGFVPAADLPNMMRNATALVIPSRSEGFGPPVGEGLAAGALVLHSRIPVLEETSGGAALLFDPDSPDELARCMRRAAADPALSDELRKRALKRAEHLTWDDAVRRTLDRYREMLGV